MLASLHAIGSKTVRRRAAPQPVLTRYKLLEIERKNFGSPVRGNRLHMSPCVMSITAAQPATTPLPLQLSETEFTACICPHLAMPKRAPKCTLGSQRVFTLIVWVLSTGMQWKCLPVSTAPPGKPAIHDTTV
jgi:hypothetical protein